MPDLFHQAVAEIMREELETARLVVALVLCDGWMGDDGRKRRVAEDRNPGWYRKFCDQYQHSRTRPRRRKHGDTMIKRAHTLRALAEIGRGEIKTVYAHRLWPYVKKRGQEIAAEHKTHHGPWWEFLKGENL